MAPSRLTLSLSLLLLAFCFFGHANSASHAAPAPAVDCSSLILNMADCLSFVSNDSKASKPEPTCCTGLKTVLKADAACLCSAFKAAPQMGVVLNMTKAMSLPAACKVSAPSVTNCGLSVAPVGAPVAALSPQSALSPEAAAGVPESSGAGGNVVAPAAAPGNSASAMLFSSATLFLGLLVASLSYL